MTALVTASGHESEKGDRVAASGHGNLPDEHMDANATTETASGQKPPPVTPRADQARPAAVGILQPVTPGHLARTKDDEIDSGQKTSIDHDVTVHGKIAIETSNDHPVLDRLTANGKQREHQWREQSREPSNRERALLSSHASPAETREAREDR